MSRPTNSRGLVASDMGPLPFKAHRRVGVWVMHKSFGAGGVIVRDDERSWTITHEPSGLSARSFITHACGLRVLALIDADPVIREIGKDWEFGVGPSYDTLEYRALRDFFAGAPS